MLVIIFGVFLSLFMIFLFLNIISVFTPRKVKDRAGIVIDFIVNDEPNNGIIMEHRTDDATDVHDHAIQESIKLSYSKLELWVENNQELIIPPEQCLKQVKNYMFKNENDTEKIEKAYSTLKIIKKHNGFLNSIKRTELEILSHVWSRIQAPVNKSVQQQLMDHLIEQLAEASIDFNKDLARCLTGRISRIIQSLESMDTENIVNIVSSSVIKNELNDKVPLLINKYIEAQWTNEQKNKYDNDDKELTEELRQYVQKQLTKDYLDSNLLTEKQFKNTIKMYIEAI